MQAHHFKGTGGMSGVALKAPDDWAMPLCFSCHAHLHQNMDRAMVTRQWEWMDRTRAKFWKLMVDALGTETMSTLVRGVARGQVIGGRRT